MTKLGNKPIYILFEKKSANSEWNNLVMENGTYLLGLDFKFHGGFLIENRSGTGQNPTGNESFKKTLNKWRAGMISGCWLLTDQWKVLIDYKDELY